MILALAQIGLSDLFDFNDYCFSVFFIFNSIFSIYFNSQSQQNVHNSTREQW